MLKTILTFHDAMAEALGKGSSLKQILNLPVKTEIARMKEQEDVETIKSFIGEIDQSFGSLEVER
jgi:vacuolar-type H+-ATPase catalytic subunit A/Vma1